MVLRTRARRVAATVAALGLLVGLSACSDLNTGYGFVPSRTAGAPDVLTAAPDGTATPPTPALTALPPDDAPTATLGILPTSGPTVTPPATLLATDTPGTPCATQACATAATHFWLERPIPADSSYVNYVDRSYPYGSTQGGQREPHHGVEFFNNAGTPILAAASGEVVVAGQDSAVAYGPATDFYGKLVVIQLDQTYQGQPVFNLYGHMLSIRVLPGQHVQTGDLLGAVGETGVAIGPHLHFEVRVGRDDYTTTRNPELWLKPLSINGKVEGAIAGRVVDLSGNLLPDVTVAIKPIATVTDKPRNRFLTTYALDPYVLNGDDQLQENFAIGDMPPGLYVVSVSTSKFYQQTLTVISDQVAWITFVVKPPSAGPTVTPGSDTTGDATPAPGPTLTPGIETPDQAAPTAGPTVPPGSETPDHATPASITPTP